MAAAVGRGSGEGPLRQVADARGDADRRAGRDDERRVGPAARTSIRARGIAPGIAFPRLLSSQISWRIAAWSSVPGANRRE